MAAAPTSTSAAQYSDTTNIARAVPASENSPTPILATIIGENIQPNIEYYVWPSVNVSQGWYVFEATMPSINYSAISEQVYVLYGPDISCLSTALTSPATVEVTSLSSSSSTSASTSTSTTSSKSSASSVGSASEASLKHIGPIVGGILGAVVFLALAAVACFLLYRKRRTKIAKSSARHGPGRWNRLSSVHSRGVLMGDDTGRRNVCTDAIGTLPFMPSDNAIEATEKPSIYSRPSDASPFSDAYATQDRPSIVDSFESSAYLPSSPARASTPSVFMAMSRTSSLASSATHHIGVADPFQVTPSPFPPSPPSPNPEYKPRYMARSESAHDGSEQELMRRSSFGSGGLGGARWIS